MNIWPRSSPRAKRELRPVDLAGIRFVAHYLRRNFTDVFKTPGKMRGKTPRTARKRNVEESRVVSRFGVIVMKPNVVKLISLP